MTINNNVGCSENTLQKQEDFQRWFGVLHNIIDSWSFRYKVKKPYYYIDMNAGPGRYPVDGKFIEGSPLRFLNIARGYMEYRAVFIEEEEQSLLELQTLFEGYKRNNIRTTYLLGNHDIELLNYLQRDRELVKSFGLLYHDPNGLPSFDVLRQFAEQALSIDIMVYMSANNYNRVRKYHEYRGQKHELLTTWIASIPKKEWTIREPSRNADRWTFLCGMNKPGGVYWDNGGWHRVTSSRGQEILEHVTYTNDEKRARRHDSLFDQEKTP